MQGFTLTALNFNKFGKDCMKKGRLDSQQIKESFLSFLLQLPQVLLFVMYIYICACECYIIYFIYTYI